jgi:hypothetical protein
MWMYKTVNSSAPRDVLEPMQVVAAGELGTGEKRSETAKADR